MTVGIDGHDGVGPGFILGREHEWCVCVVLRSVLVQDHSVSTQPGAGGGQGPGHGPGRAGEKTLSQHLYEVLLQTNHKLTMRHYNSEVT